MQKSNLIQVILDKKTAEEMSKEMGRLPKYHCAREFLQACIDTFEAVEKQPTYNDVPLGGASKLIPITPLQREYLLSRDADDFFSTPVLSELLTDLRKYSL